MIRKVDASGIVNTFAGTGLPGYSGDNGPATLAKMSVASGITVDKKGNVYFLDVANFRVRKVNTAGIITTVAGNGTSGVSGDGGPATAAEIGGVEWSGLCMDDTGNLYVYGEYRIRKIDTFGIITMYAGSVAGFSGDGGPATAAMLRSGAQLATDPSGNLYISDASNFRVRKVNAAGIITTVAGNGVYTFSGYV